MCSFEEEKNLKNKFKYKEKCKEKKLILKKILIVLFLNFNMFLKKKIVCRLKFFFIFCVNFY